MKTTIILFFSIYYSSACYGQELSGSYESYYYFSSKDGERNITNGKIDLAYANFVILSFNLKRNLLFFKIIKNET